jgi:hypothetical protein
LSNNAALSTELVARADADASVATNLSTEIVDRAAAVSTELSRAESAETSLDTDLGLHNMGTESEYSDYLDALANGYDATYFGGQNYTALDFQTSFGPANLANYTIWRDKRVTLGLYQAITDETSRAESAEASLDVAKLNLAGGTMSGNIDMGGNNFVGADEIHAFSTGTDRIYTNAFYTKDGDPISIGSNLDAKSTQSIINLPAPTNDGDAANKLYVDSALSTELSRAEFAEASIATQLSSEVSYIIANTDLTSIDSFAEVVADMSTEIARAESAEASIALDFANIYAKHVAVNETPDGTAVAFTIAIHVREGSELVYLNGLLLDAGDYTPDMVEGKVAGFTFINAPLSGDKVRAYGVC